MKINIIREAASLKRRNLYKTCQLLITHFLSIAYKRGFAFLGWGGWGHLTGFQDLCPTCKKTERKYIQRELI